MCYAVLAPYSCCNSLVIVKPGTERTGIWIEYLLVTTTETELSHVYEMFYRLEGQINLNLMVLTTLLLLRKGEEMRSIYQKGRVAISELILEKMGKIIGKM